MKYLISLLIPLFLVSCGYIDSGKVQQEEKVLKELINDTITPEPLPIPAEIVNEDPIA